MQKQYGVGSVVFDKWTIKRKIGEGSFGKVFEIQREDFGQIYKAALKVITVPQSQAEVQSAMEEGLTYAQADEYFYGVVEAIVQEFAIMAKLKGTANVVGYEDHAVIRHQDGVGWDILIRMELLHPLLPYAYAHPFARRDIIRLGIDICRALELCQKYNVIHRDIKPENIFVSDNGDFKLGDFGIARTIDRTMSGLSKKGTYNYMAPEVYRGAKYGFSVDIYSLGIVLYRLLNKNRVPFLPPSPAPITFQDRELALARRMGGEVLPAPVHARGRLAEIVLKACAFDPKERYSTPAQMRQELEAILYDAADAELIYPDGDELALMENQYAFRTPEGGREQTGEPENTASMFGNADVSGGFNASRTESVFGGAPHKDRTESVFGAPAGKERMPHAAPVREKKPILKKLLPAAAGAAVLALVIVAVGPRILNREQGDGGQEIIDQMGTTQRAQWDVNSLKASGVTEFTERDLYTPFEELSLDDQQFIVDLTSAAIANDTEGAKALLGYEPPIFVYTMWNGYKIQLNNLEETVSDQGDRFLGAEIEMRPENGTGYIYNVHWISDTDVRERESSVDMIAVTRIVCPCTDWSWNGAMNYTYDVFNCETWQNGNRAETTAHHAQSGTVTDGLRCGTFTADGYESTVWNREELDNRLDFTGTAVYQNGVLISMSGDDMAWDGLIAVYEGDVSYIDGNNLSFYGTDESRRELLFW